jgi:hypothetical protein
MSRTVEFKCEECQVVAFGALVERPATWWLLEDQGREMRTGPLDFCSLMCLSHWLAHPELRTVYAADWPQLPTMDSTTAEVR